eukprot:434636-Pyramimonas_sp.AAC.1
MSANVAALFTPGGDGRDPGGSTLRPRHLGRGSRPRGRLSAYWCSPLGELRLPFAFQSVSVHVAP